MKKLKTPDQILTDVGINVENFKKDKNILYRCIRRAMNDFASNEIRSFCENVMNPHKDSESWIKERLQDNYIDTGEKSITQDVKHRYFLVAFAATHPKGSANGSAILTTNGTYLGRAETIADIEKKYRVTNVAILSVDELAEDDFNYYINN